MTIKTKKEVYTVSEVADRLRISRNLVYTLCRQKQLPGVIHLGKWRMVVSAIALDKLLSGDGHQL